MVRVRSCFPSSELLVRSLSLFCVFLLFYFIYIYSVCWPCDSIGLARSRSLQSSSDIPFDCSVLPFQSCSFCLVSILKHLRRGASVFHPTSVASASDDEDSIVFFFCWFVGKSWWMTELNVRPTHTTCLFRAHTNIPAHIVAFTTA